MEPPPKHQHSTVSSGKPPKVALIAIARKLLTILNAMLRDETDWHQATA
jgi:transposase